jgi:hypothetical protein
VSQACTPWPLKGRSRGYESLCAHWSWWKSATFDRIIPGQGQGLEGPKVAGGRAGSDRLRSAALAVVTERLVAFADCLAESDLG